MTICKANRFIVCVLFVSCPLPNSVQDMVRAWPVWMQANLARVVSHHPLRDVSIITWFAFLLGCYRFGEGTNGSHHVSTARRCSVSIAADVDIYARVRIDQPEPDTFISSHERSVPVARTLPLNPYNDFRSLSTCCLAVTGWCSSKPGA